MTGPRPESPLKRRVRGRAADRCEYCRIAQADDEGTQELEHVLALKHGGGDGEDNLALACGPCNNGKGPDLCGVDAATGTVVRLFNPRRQRWEDHFELIRGEVRGLTPTGRASALLLGMNRRHRVRRRLRSERRSAPGTATGRTGP